MEPVLRRFDVRDYLRVLTKRKWFVIMVALAAMVIGGLYTVSYPKAYRASAIVLVRREGRPMIWAGDLGRQGPQRQDLALETQARIASSIDCAEQAAKQLAADTTGEAIQVSAQEIAGAITASPNEPDLLVVEAVHRDENYAIKFANAMAAAFVDRSLKLRQVQSRAAREFLVEAQRRAQLQLDAALGELAVYEEQIGVVLPEQESQGAVEQIIDYETQLHSGQAVLAEARADVAILAAQLRATPAFKTMRHETANPQRQTLLNQLLAAQVSLAELRARYTDNWPAVQQMKDRIVELEAEIARVPETTAITSVEPDPLRASLEQELGNAQRKVAGTQSRLNSLQGTVSRLRALKLTMPEKLNRLQSLLARVDLARSTYKNVQAQLENARLNEAMEHADAELIDHAAVAAEISPKLGRMLVSSLALGLATGIALALFLEALDDTLHGPEDVAAYTEATFLGMVPQLEEQAGGLVTVLSPKSPPAEAYRTLRSNINFAQVDYPARTFVVTSAGAGEGKTTTTANLAVVFAQAGQEVLLVDADLRRPSVHRIFNVPSERGLTNVLVGESTLAEVIVETDVPGLRLVPTGPLPPNPAELLESAQMTRIIEQSRDLADIVIFDSPPAIVLTDAVIVSSKVDRTILVAEAGQVTRDAFNEMCRLITNARGTILGVILNKVRLSAADYYYYYYYYDYSHYSPRRSAADMPASTRQATPENGFSHPDAPTVLEDIFGPEEGAPPQPPAIGRPPAIEPEDDTRQQ
jgi:capsular exopolysaccharide synthesis family protein